MYLHNFKYIPDLIRFTGYNLRIFNIYYNLIMINQLIPKI